MLTVKLTEEFHREVAAKVDDTLLDELATQAALHKRYTARLKELNEQEDRYLDLIGDPDWPQAKLNARIAKLRVERKHLEEQREHADDNLELGKQVLIKALSLLEDPQALYRESDSAGKRLLTLTLFKKLYVDTYSIVGHELNEPEK